jgi:cell division protein YceG involved in septum cleavage
LIETPGVLRPEFVPPEGGLEGYLFPASYEIPLGSSAEGALGLMLGRLRAS